MNETEKRKLLAAIDDRIKPESPADEITLTLTLRESNQYEGEWFSQTLVVVDKVAFNDGAGLQAKAGNSTLFHLSDIDALKLAQAIIKLTL